jgi:hypothetical protein
MGYLRRLFESRPWQTLIPDQSIIMGDAGEGMDHARAARSYKGDFVFVYLPTGNSVTVDMGMVSGKQAVAWWFNPRSAAVARIGRFHNEKNPMEFDPPGLEDRGNDWVLVIDNARKRYSLPGWVRDKSQIRW